MRTVTFVYYSLFGKVFFLYTILILYSVCDLSLAAIILYYILKSNIQQW